MQKASADFAHTILKFALELNCFFRVTSLVMEEEVAVLVEAFPLSGHYDLSKDYVRCHGGCVPS